MYTLHPITMADVTAFLQSAQGPGDAANLAWLETVGDKGMQRVLSNLALYLAQRYPTFYFEDVSLTFWEASIERGLGMLLRPPSRLLTDGGMDRLVAARFPIRLDQYGGPMGGAYIPASLVLQAVELLESKHVRQVHRLHDAGLDPVANLGSMIVALRTAAELGTGVFEAARIALPPNAQNVTVAAREGLPEDLRHMLELAAKPAKTPGLISRLTHRRKSGSSADAAMEKWLAE
ncbi:MAG TPA: hypothetical protein PK819_02925 [Thermomicrobiales bacterium]|nr:hypothetical protein [Thermomicrobiales bacterium]